MTVAARLIISSPPPKTLAMWGETKLVSTPLPVMNTSTPRKPQRRAWGMPSRSRTVSRAEPAAGTAPDRVVEVLDMGTLLRAARVHGPPGATARVREEGAAADGMTVEPAHTIVKHKCSGEACVTSMLHICRSQT